MAYSFTRLGHVAANQWEQWGSSGANIITNVVGPVWFLAFATGATSGATAYIITLGTDFSGYPLNVVLLRVNGTAFIGGETVNITGGGSFTLPAAVFSTAIHPCVIVNGSDTANLFDAVAQQSISAGWGYHSLTKSSQLVLNCSIIVGTPNQTAVTSAISKLESVELNGSLWCGGNATYPSTFKIGDGIIGSPATSRLGSVIDCNVVAPILWNGSTRYGYVECHASTINNVEAGWKCGYQRVESWESGSFAGIGMTLSGNATWGKAASDIATVNSCSVYETLGASHIYPNFSDVKIDATVAGTNAGIVSIGGGDYVATNITVENASNSIIGFATGGIKTFRNCYLDVTTVISFLSGMTTLHQWTIDINCKNAAGTNIPGVRVRAWNGLQNPLSDTPLFDVTTGAGGSIAQQIFTFYRTQTGAADINYNPITLWITKTGWKETKIVKTLDDILDLTLTLETIEKDPMTG